MAMIPKIIHYCWLSGEAYPTKIQDCMNSWKRFLPDYDFVLWDLNRFDLKSSVWVKEAVENKKYAFAADYIRIYALYNYGGIYLDSDVEVLKPFDDLLHLPYFLGKENTASGIEAATMGFEKGHPLLESLLKKYEGRHFHSGVGKFETLPLPFVIRRCIDERFKYVSIPDVESFDYSNDVVSILPVDYFSPKDYQTRELKVTRNTYSIHHFSGSWKVNKGFLEKTRIYFRNLRHVLLKNKNRR